MQIDLTQGMVPISKVAATLAGLIVRARTQQIPIVITQKGRPTAVLLDLDSYLALRARAEGQGRTKTLLPSTADQPTAAD